MISNNQLYLFLLIIFIGILSLNNDEYIEKLTMSEQIFSNNEYKVRLNEISQQKPLNGLSSENNLLNQNNIIASSSRNNYNNLQNKIISEENNYNKLNTANMMSAMNYNNRMKENQASLERSINNSNTLYKKTLNMNLSQKNYITDLEKNASMATSIQNYKETIARDNAIMSAMMINSNDLQKVNNVNASLSTSLNALKKKTIPMPTTVAARKVANPQIAIISNKIKNLETQLKVTRNIKIRKKILDSIVKLKAEYKELIKEGFTTMGIKYTPASYEQNGNNSFDKQRTKLGYFNNNVKYSPEACLLGSNLSNSLGCAEFTQEDVNFLRRRGNNTFPFEL